MLIVFAGLPGTGKSTISRNVAQRLGAVYVRIDTIEQALRDLEFEEVYAHGYEIAYKIANDNLLLGQSVVADSVNPIGITRHAWRDVAHAASVDIVEIEITCSDEREHQRRVETRTSTIKGLTLPTWESVLAHHYEPWDLTPTQKTSRDGEHIVIDTAGESPEQSTARTLSKI